MPKFDFNIAKSGKHFDFSGWKSINCSLTVDISKFYWQMFYFCELVYDVVENGLQWCDFL